jgi:hypothetical protein
MKFPLLLSAGILSVTTCFAQTQADSNVIPAPAFNRMIVQDITYTIVGENTPTSGLKIDVSKPEATASGTFVPKKDWIPWDFFGVEFKGGVSDRNFNFFKGSFSSFNTAFELNTSFHFIPYWNSTKYGSDKEDIFRKKIIIAQNELVKRSTASLIDTFYVVTRLINRHLYTVKGEEESLPEEVAAETITHKKIAIHLIRKLRDNDSLAISDSLSLSEILNYLPPANDTHGSIDIDTYNNEAELLYIKYKALYEGYESASYNKMIANASQFWTKKSYYWITASPFIKTEKVNEYYSQYEGKDSSYFKSDYHVYYGGSVYINGYWILPKRTAHLLRVGFSASFSNNIASLSTFNYEKTTSFFNYDSTVTEKTESGTAYNHSQIKTGFLKQLSVEYYLLPLQSKTPGFYLSTSLTHSSLYKLPDYIGRENDKLKWSLEGGPLFNIKDKEKDKPLLSLLIYFRHEDLTDKRRTDAKTNIRETWEKFNNRNLSFGIKVGIPITLPKNQD